MATLRTLAAILGIMALAAACATTPAPGSKTIPSWVTTTPKPTAAYTYFVGSGSDGSGNIASANENAVHSLIGDVTRYLGVSVSSQTTVETQADLKSFETHLAESIKESSSAEVGDFTIVDRWVRTNGRQVTVFLLGKYKTSALNAEKARLEALRRERTDAVALPERRGDGFLAEGRAYKAAVEYMQAALAATSGNVANAQIKFERNIKKAVEAVGMIRLKPVVDNLKGMVGKPLPKPFQVEATATRTGGIATLTDAPFRVSYPVLRNNGRIGTASLHLTSDAGGRLAVTLPPPHLIGHQTVAVSLDLSPQLDPLLHAAPAQKALVAALEKQINAVRIELSYTTTSEAASIPTGVLVMDLDRGGTRIPQDDTAAGIESSLTQAGFQILPIPSNPSILGIDDADLVKILRNNFGSKIKRAIIGQAKISGFQQSEGNYIVKVTGKVEVAELATGKVLLSMSQIKLSRASDASSAITAAFKDLGVSIGNEIKNRLN